MPACFQLTEKGKEGPEKLGSVDEKMARHFGQEPDKKYWFQGWYNSIGLRLALGNSWDELREEYKDDEEYLMIIDWLENNYEVNHWRGYHE